MPYQLPMRLWQYALLIALAFTAASQAEPPAAPGRSVLAADYSTHRIAIIGADGAVEWEHPIESIHDLQLLSNGHVLFQTTWTRIVEIDPSSRQVAWEYDSSAANGNQGKRVEVHSFQRLPSGDTMVAESGPGRIIEVDAAGNLQRQVALKIDHPDPHRDTRLVRKLASGNYLVAHEGTVPSVSTTAKGTSFGSSPSRSSGRSHAAGMTPRRGATPSLQPSGSPMATPSSPPETGTASSR